jgi:hypothetical protein
MANETHPGADRAAEATPASQARFEALHVERVGSLEVALAIDATFELFTPLGERLWVPGWDPTFLFPRDGSLAAGGVFTTVADGRTTVWMVIEHDPGRHRVRYARITPGVHAVEVAVRCRSASDTATHVGVCYTLTALSPTGNEELELWTEAWYGEYLEGWTKLLSRHIEDGRQNDASGSGR